MLTIKSCVCTIFVLFIFTENFLEATTGHKLTSSVSSVGQIQRMKREVQLTTNLDDHTSLIFATTTEEKILYISLVLAVLLTVTCCCVFWKYCCCDVRQSRTIIYQQMPASQMPTVINGQVTLQAFPPVVTTLSSSELRNLIPMTTYNSSKEDNNDGYSALE